MNVLIIGGSSDIGLDLAKYLFSINYNVIATYNTHKCDVNNIEYLKCDIKNEDDIERVIKYTMKKYERIDVLINMAATYYDDELSNLSKDKYMEVLEVNTIGPLLTTKIYDKYIKDGLIINIGSTDGIDTYNEYNILYASSKAALINMTKSVAMATSNRVLCLSPNWIASSSTNKMDKEYLNSELKRVKQSRLITIAEFNQSVEKIIKNNLPSGSIIRLDIRDDQLCLEKMQ